ncbi:MAG: hypothetical protein N4A76_05250 [Firmicutes bacterium]|nr:hypothetical protein [Bacillota bacterium]
MKTKFSKSPLRLMLILVLTLVMGSGVVYANEVEDMETISFILEDGNKELQVFDVNTSEYFRLDQFAEMMGLHYKINNDDTVYISKEDTYISGLINDEDNKCKIKKEGIKTDYVYYSTPFLFDGSYVYIRSDLAVTVFIDHSYKTGLKAYNTVNPIGVIWNYNGDPIKFEDYILIGNMIYVDLESFRSKYGAENIQFKASGDKMRVSNSKLGYEYTLSLNSPKIAIKNFGEINTFDSPFGANEIAKVGDKYYIDLAFAMVGNYSMDDSLNVDFYNAKTYEAKVREEYKFNNLFDLLNTITEMKNFDSASSAKIEMLEDGKYESAGILSSSYSKKDNKVYFSVSSDAQNNDNSPFYYGDMNQTSIFDMSNGALYEKTENGFWHKTTGQYDSETMMIISGLNDNLFNQYLMLIGRESYGDREEFKEKNQMYLSTISTFLNDDLLVKDGKGYRYKMDLNKLVKILKPVYESNSFARELIDALESEEVKMDLDIDIKIDIKKKSISAISGKIRFEVEEYRQNGINITFKSIIKSPSEFEMPSEEYILE